MEYNTNNSQMEKGIDIATIMQYAIRVLQKWWAILLAAVICASVGFVVATVNYVPKYTCEMRFVIDNKSENTITGGQSVSDINAGMQLARDYVVIMTESSTLMDMVAKGSGYEITGDQVSKMLNGSLVEDTSIVSYLYYNEFKMGKYNAFMTVARVLMGENKYNVVCQINYEKDEKFAKMQKLYYREAYKQMILRREKAKTEEKTL